MSEVHDSITVQDGPPVLYEDAPELNPLTPTATPITSTFDIADPSKYHPAPLPPKRKRGGRPGIGADALNLLRDLPEVRPIPWYAGKNLPAERSTESPRGQTRGACLLASRGKVNDPKCTHCASGVGRFALCVTLDGWFLGACATCQMGSRGNTCSLRMAAEGRFNDPTKQEDSEDTSDHGSAPTEHMTKAEEVIQRRVEDVRPAGETVDLSHLRSPSPDALSPLSFPKRKLDSISTSTSPKQNPISCQLPVSKRVRETYSEPRQQAAETPTNRWNSVPPINRTPLPSQPQYIPRSEDDKSKGYSLPQIQQPVYVPAQKPSPQIPSPPTYSERQTQVQYAQFGPTHPSQNPYPQPTYNVAPGPPLSQPAYQHSLQPHTNQKTVPNSFLTNTPPRHNLSTTTITPRPQTQTQRNPHPHPHPHSHSHPANQPTFQTSSFTTPPDPRSISTSTSTCITTSTILSSPQNIQGKDDGSLIDTLNRKQRNAVYGMIGGIQGGIRIIRQQADELQRQLDLLQEMLGVE